MWGYDDYRSPSSQDLEDNHPNPASSTLEPQGSVMAENKLVRKALICKCSQPLPQVALAHSLCITTGLLGTPEPPYLGYHQEKGRR